MVRMRRALIAVVALATAPAGASALTVAITPSGVSAPQQNVVAEFSEPVAAETITAESFSVRELLGTRLRTPLDAASVSDLGGQRRWLLSFPSDFGSSRTYRVSLRGIRAVASNEAFNFDRDFSTGIDANVPLSLVRLDAAASGTSIVVTWSAPLDFDRAGVVLLRRKGTIAPRPGTPESLVIGRFPTPTARFEDRSLRPGQVYTYAAYPYDADRLPGAGPAIVADSVTANGNVGAPEATIAARPGRRLLRPANPQLVRSDKPLNLRWTRVPGAEFYNVQLFRGSAKVLSVFPDLTGQKIAASTLKAGTYTLFVWGGSERSGSVRYSATPWITQRLTVT